MSENKTGGQKFVYDFAEGNKDLKDLLGGKGANLAEMTNLGLPVPPGFTITTEACKAYLDTGDEPGGAARRGRARTSTPSRSDDGQAARRGRRPAAGLGPLRREVLDARDDGDRPQHRPQRRVGRGPGRAGRQRALRLGLLPPPASRCSARPCSASTASTSRRRSTRPRRPRASPTTSTSTPPTCSSSSRTFKEIVAEHAGRDFPQDPREQLDLAILAVFDSWNTDRAMLYRRQERIPADLGTAVNICSMVFGNLGMDSGTGVAFTRDPATGQQRRLRRLPAERAGRGRRRRHPQHPAARRPRAASTRRPTTSCMAIMETLESHYRDLCDIEFTIERGKLWMLQTRVGKRTAGAAFRIATQLVDEGLIDLDEALQRVTGAQLAQLMFPRFDDDADADAARPRHDASPGRRRRQGRLRLGHRRQVVAARGEKVILVRRETNPDDLDGMIAAEGILTSRGGKTSHAAVVARGMGKTCVCGAEELEVDTKRRTLHRARRRGRRGGRRHLDRRLHRRGLPRRGAGRPVAGRRVLRGPDARRRRRRRRPGRAPSTGSWPTPTGVRRLRVRANADTAEDAAARPPLRRPGHRPVPHRAHVPRRAPRAVERLILADTDDEREAGARRSCCRCSATTSSRSSRRWTGCPSPSGCSTRRCTSSCPTSPSCRCASRSPRPARTPNENDLRLLAGRAPAARAEPDARPARRAARPGHPRPVRDAGPGDRRGRRRAQEGRRRPARRDHDPAGRHRPGAGDSSARRPSRSSPRSQTADRRRPRAPRSAR